MIRSTGTRGQLLYDVDFDNRYTASHSKPSDSKHTSSLVKQFLLAGTGSKQDQLLAMKQP